MTESGADGVAVPGVLFVVSNTLGNPEDLTPRAVRVLGEVDLIFAEDTRTARRLLSTLGIDCPLRSCFDANEGERAEEAALQLREGKKLALFSEAGTPAVSDPGFRVVRAAIDEGAPVVPVPGASAVLSALVASGLPPDRFIFAGFPPRKSGSRQALFRRFRSMPETLVFYESPHRVGETLADMAGVLGATRKACVARELTKTHESFVRGPLGALADRYAKDRPLGEITIVVAGSEEDAHAELDSELPIRAERLLAAGYSPRDTTQILVAETGSPRKAVYDLVQGVKKTTGS